MQRFSPQERESAYRWEFRTRRRQKQESITDYGYALKRLACNAYPNLPVNALETVVVDQHILGLGEHEVKRHVQFGHPKSLESAIALAVEFEAFEGSLTNRKPEDQANLVN